MVLWVVCNFDQQNLVDKPKLKGPIIYLFLSEGVSCVFKILMPEISTSGEWRWVFGMFNILTYLLLGSWQCKIYPGVAGNPPSRHDLLHVHS